VRLFPFPYVLSARKALAERLGRIDSYVAHAQAVTATLTDLRSVLAWDACRDG
jgi:hypothetical protein